MTEERIQQLRARLEQKRVLGLYTSRELLAEVAQAQARIKELEEQLALLTRSRQCVTHPDVVAMLRRAGVPAYLWRPGDCPQIEAILKGGKA